PDWALEGTTIGLKDGVVGFERLEHMLNSGVTINAIWCEDWVGLRETSFGSRLFWDWHVNAERYPDLKSHIAKLEQRGIRFLGYVNPYLCIDGKQFDEAKAGDHLVRHANGGDIYTEDFGEFDCGMIDLTRQQTRDWFAKRIIGEEMIDLGMAGWMADFGEYLPTDTTLHDGSDPMKAHNRWPVLWAQVNEQAAEHCGVQDEAVFFMRSGGAGLSRHCSLLWAGDQCVDFSRHDGIGTAITAALSVGLVGNGHSHSDIGGYTSLHGLIRTRELIMRWAEMAVFTPFMRTHEGNRPKDNLQVDSDPELLDHFAAMTRLHAALAPYSKSVNREVASLGLPMQRAMFLHYADDPQTHSIQDQYLYGRDLLVAPVITQGATTRSVFIPAGDSWNDFWTGEPVAHGWLECAAPIGFPPAFVRAGSTFLSTFAAARAAHMEWGNSDD
ncbi:MAG: alpha-glucosidase, partial [Pseudomonadota bacterium]